MDEVRIQTYSDLPLVVPNWSFIRIVEKDTIPYGSTSFIIPNDFSKKTLNISTFYNQYANSASSLVIVVIESSFYIQDIDILPGNALDGLESMFIFLVNLGKKYITLKNSDVSEKFQRYVYS